MFTAQASAPVQDVFSPKLSLPFTGANRRDPTVTPRLPPLTCSSAADQPQLLPRSWQGRLGDLLLQVSSQAAVAEGQPHLRLLEQTFDQKLTLTASPYGLSSVKQN